MARVQTVIDVNINTSPAAAGIRSLAAQFNAFQSTLNRGNQAQAAQAKALSSSLKDLVNQSQFFTAETVRMKTGAAQLDSTLSRGRASMGQFFSARFRKDGMAAAQVLSLANSRAASLQTQFIATGAAAGGMREAIAIKPLTAFNSAAAVSAQKLAIQRAMLNQATTSMINFGKNTQWAGRQLMVGFTVPLTIFAGMAGKAFRELEKEAINFRKVYGDIFTTDMEVERNLDAVKELSKEFTKYGIAAKDTMRLAAIAAQSGQRGAELQQATIQATRLATLGEMENQDAMRTTIALQSAFKLSNDDLADSINFLNFVENSSVMSLQDLADAIPRVAPVIVGLGGDVKDMAVFLTAMREGGVGAADAANGLKSSLGRLIVPTKQAKEMAAEFGISLEGIVQRNKGDILATVTELANAMKGLGDLEQQQLLSTIFGKFQFARIGALFQNITREGSQAQKIIEAMEMSTEQLARTADQELSAIEDSVSTKFTAAMEKLKLEIAPIGEMFVRMALPIVNFIAKIAEKFNDLPDFAKNFAGLAAAIVGLVIPAGTMFLGLLMNLIGTLVKAGHVIGLAFKGFFSGGIKKAIDNVSQALNYMSLEEIESAEAAKQLGLSTELVNKAFRDQVGSAAGAQAAIGQLAGVYNRLQAEILEVINLSARASTGMSLNFGAGARAMASTAAVTGGRQFTMNRAGLFVPRNEGGTIPGVGNKDTVPAMLTPGEFVINKQATQQNLPLLQAINSGESVPGFNKGGMIPGVQYLFGGGLAKAIQERLKASRLKALEKGAEPKTDENTIAAQLDKIDKSSRNSSVFGRAPVVDDADLSFVQPLGGRSSGLGINSIVNHKGKKKVVQIFETPESAQAAAVASYVDRAATGAIVPTRKISFVKVGDKLLPATLTDFDPRISDRSQFAMADPGASAVGGVWKAGKFVPRASTDRDVVLDPTQIIPVDSMLKKLVKMEVGGGTVVQKYLSQRLAADIQAGGISRNDFRQLMVTQARTSRDSVRTALDDIPGYLALNEEQKQQYRSLYLSRYDRLENSVANGTLVDNMYDHLLTVKLTPEMLQNANPQAIKNGIKHLQQAAIRNDGDVSLDNVRGYAMGGMVSETGGKKIPGVAYMALGGLFGLMKRRQLEKQRREAAARLAQSDSGFPSGRVLSVDEMTGATGPSQLQQVRATQQTVQRNVAPSVIRRRTRPIIEPDTPPFGGASLRPERAHFSSNPRLTEETAPRNGGIKERLARLLVRTGLPTYGLTDDWVVTPAFLNQAARSGTTTPLTLSEAAQLSRVHSSRFSLSAEKSATESMMRRAGIQDSGTDFATKIADKLDDIATNPAAYRNLITRVDQDGNPLLTDDILNFARRQAYPEIQGVQPRITGFRLPTKGEVAELAGVRTSDVDGINRWLSSQNYPVRVVQVSGSSRSTGRTSSYYALAEVDSAGNIVSVNNTEQKMKFAASTAFNKGGQVFTPEQSNIVPGVGNKDTVPAVLTPGEFVINKKATAENLPLLHSINNGEVSGFNKGGMIPGVQHMFLGGLMRMVRKSAADKAAKAAQTQITPEQAQPQVLYHRGNLEEMQSTLPVTRANNRATMGPATYGDPRRSEVNQWGRQGDLVYKITTTKPMLDMGQNFFESAAMQSVFPKWASNLKKQMGVDITRYLPFKSQGLQAKIRKLLKKNPNMTIGEVQAYVATELAGTIAARTGISRMSRDGIQMEAQINEQFRRAVVDSGFGGGRIGSINAIYDLNSVNVQRTQAGPMLPPTAALNAGDIVPGAGSRDTVPAMLTPGEFVVNKKATSQNMGLLHAINDGKSVGFGKGGTVQYFEEGGRVLPGRTAATGAETRAIPLPRNAVQIGRGANVGLGFAAAQTAISQMTGRLVGFTKQVTDSFSQGARAAKQANKAAQARARGAGGGIESQPRENMLSTARRTVGRLRDDARVTQGPGTNQIGMKEAFLRRRGTVLSDPSEAVIVKNMLFENAKQSAKNFGSALAAGVRETYISISAGITKVKASYDKMYARLVYEVTMGFPTVVSAAKLVWQATGILFDDLKQAVINGYNVAKASAISAFQSVTTFFRTLPQTIMSALQSIRTSIVTNVLTPLMTLATNIGGAIMGAAATAYQNIFQPAVTAIVNLAQTIGGAIRSVATTAYQNIVQPVITAVSNFAQTVAGAIRGVATSAFQNIIQPGMTAVMNLAQAIGGAITNVATSAYQNIVQRATTAATALANAIRFAINNPMQALLNSAGFIRGLPGQLVNSITNMFNASRDGFNAATGFVGTQIARLREPITNLFNTVRNAFVTAGSAVAAFPGQVIDSVRTLFTRTKDAYWMAITRVDMLRTSIVDGVTQFAGKMRTTLAETAAAATTQIKTATMAGATALGNGINRAVIAITTPVGTAINGIGTRLLNLKKAFDGRFRGTRTEFAAGPGGIEKVERRRFDIFRKTDRQALYNDIRNPITQGIKNLGASLKKPFADAQRQAIIEFGKTRKNVQDLGTTLNSRMMTLRTNVARAIDRGIERTLELGVTAALKIGDLRNLLSMSLDNAKIRAGELGTAVVTRLGTLRTAITGGLDKALTKALELGVDAVFRIGEVKKSFIQSFNNMKTEIATKIPQVKRSINELYSKMLVGTINLAGNVADGSVKLKSAVTTFWTKMQAGVSGAAGMALTGLAKVGQMGGGPGGMMGKIGGGIRQAGSGMMMASMIPMMAAMMPGMEEHQSKLLGAGMGLSLIPMLTMMPPALSAVLVAAGALAAAFYFLRKSVDETAREAAKMGANVGGAANRMESVKAATGYSFASERLGNQLFGFSDEDRKAISQFSQYFEGEKGKKFIDQLKQMGQKERYEQVSSTIAQAIADGMDEKSAKEYGYAIAYYTNDAILKTRLASDFKNNKYESGTQALVDLLKSRQDAVDKELQFAPKEVGQSSASRGLANITGIGTRDTATSIGAEGVAKAGLGAGVGALTGLGVGAGLAGLGSIASLGTMIGAGISFTAPVVAGAGGAAAGAAAGSVVPVVGTIVGAVAGLAIAGVIAWKQYQEQIQRLNDNIKSSAAIWGASIQTLKEVRNAEAALIEARQKGTITDEEFEKQMGEVRAVEERASTNLKTVIDSMMVGGQVDEGALNQALKDQLVLGGFEGDLATAVTNTVNFKEIAKALFPEIDPEDVAADSGMSEVVKQVMVETLAGITPENAQQRIADVRSQWALIAQDLLDAAKGGLGDAKLTGPQARGTLAKAAAAQEIDRAYDSSRDITSDEIISASDMTAEERAKDFQGGKVTYDERGNKVITGESGTKYKEAAEPKTLRQELADKYVSEIDRTGKTAGQISAEEARARDRARVDSQKMFGNKNANDFDFTMDDATEMKKLGLDAKETFEKMFRENPANIDAYLEGAFDEAALKKMFNTTDMDFINAEMADAMAASQIEIPGFEVIGTEADVAKDKWSSFVGEIAQSGNYTSGQIDMVSAAMGNLTATQPALAQEIQNSTDKSQRFADMVQSIPGNVDVGIVTEYAFAGDADISPEEYGEQVSKAATVFGDSVNDMISYSQDAENGITLDKLTAYGEKINQFPDDMKKRLDVNFDDPEVVKEFGPMADQLIEQWPILENLNKEIDMKMYTEFLTTENGKPLTYKQTEERTKRLNKLWKDFSESDNMEARKKAFFELQTLQNNGNIDPAEFNANWENMVAEFGEQKIMNLPPDVISKVYEITSEIVGAEEEKAKLEKLLAEGGELTSMDRVHYLRRIDYLNQLISSNKTKRTGLVMKGSKGSNSSGGNSGGGGGKKSLGETMKEELTGLQDQYKGMAKFINSETGQFKKTIAGPFASEFIEYLKGQGEEGIKVLKGNIKKFNELYSQFIKIQLQKSKNFVQALPSSLRTEAQKLEGQAAIRRRLRQDDMGEDQIDGIIEGLLPGVAAAYGGAGTKKQQARAKRQVEQAARQGKAPAARLQRQAVRDEIEEETAELDKIDKFVARGIPIELAEQLVDMGVSASNSGKSVAFANEMLQKMEQNRVRETVFAIGKAFEEMGKEISLNAGLMSMGYTGEFAEELKQLGVNFDLLKNKPEMIHQIADALKAMKMAAYMAKDPLEKIKENLDFQVGGLQASIEKINRIEIRPLENQIKAIQESLIPFQDEIYRLEQAMKPLNKEIKNYEKQIKSLQDNQKPLQKDIEKLQEEEKDLNKYYDERTKVLDKVSRANQRYNEQQKGLFDVASALSRGDIGAAAQATISMQQTMAQQRMEDARQALEEEREAKRLEITTQIEAKEKEIKTINEQIEKIQEQIELRQQSISNYQDLIADQQDLIAGKQREIEMIQRQIETAKKKQLELEEKIYKVQLLQSLLATRKQIQDAAMVGNREGVIAGQAQLDAQMAVANGDPNFFAGIPGADKILTAVAGYTSSVMTVEQIIDANAWKLGNASKAIADAMTASEGYLSTLDDNARNIMQQFVNGEITFGEMLKKLDEEGINIQEFVSEVFKPNLTGVLGDIEEGTTQFKDGLVGTMDKFLDGLVKGLNGFLKKVEKKVGKLNVTIPSVGVTITGTVDGKSVTGQGSTNSASTTVNPGSIAQLMYGGFARFTSNEPAPGMMYGGKMKKMAMGSWVPGTGMTDKVPALLTPGEFVVRKNVAQAYGSELSMLNSQVFPTMSSARFGLPSAFNSDVFPRVNTQTPGVNVGITRDTTVIGGSNIYYNYSIGVNANTNADPNEIANAIMYKIKRSESRQVRGTRIG